jgi:hypothetical protein
VYVSRADQQVRIILSHGSGRGACSEISTHRHGAASRVFCLFVDPTHAQPDHVASFNASSLCEIRSGAIEPKGKNPTTNFLASAVRSDPRNDQLRNPGLPKSYFLKTQPQVAQSLLGSTVLLI